MSRPAPTPETAAVPGAEARTLPELLFAQADRRGDGLALRHKVHGFWRRVSWAEYALAVRRVAAALLACGLRRRERVAILGENRPEWLYCQLGAMAAGGAACGIYPTSSPEQIGERLRHSEARVLFVEGEEHLEKSLAVVDETAVERVVVWDPKGLWGFRNARTAVFADFVREGADLLGSESGRLDQAVRAVDAGDVALVIYTSGTTGPPKGAMLSHRNILFMARALLAVNPASARDEVLSCLPFAHVYENLVSVFQALEAGYVVNFIESPETLFENLREVSPTILAGVPRMWEKLASAVELRMQDSTPLKRRAYRWAVAEGRRRGRGERRGLAHALARSTVLEPLKRRLGLDRVRLGICGAAPASPELFAHYHALGVPLLEGYGQTESSGVITVSRRGRERPGSVGEPLPGVEVRLAGDGEILTRGPHVFLGYLKDPELTAATVDGEGWLHTGDLGSLENGYLWIRDRKRG